MKAEPMRIALGHPSCPGVLRGLAAQMRALKADQPLRLTLPPVTPTLDKDVDEILRIAQAFSDVEIAANDWGTLARLSEWKKTRAPKLTLILGVLLSAQDTDPVLDTFLSPQPENAVRAGQEAVTLRWAPPPEALRQHWATPSAFHWTPLLREMGVDAVELGLQPLPLTDADGRMPIRAYPFGVLSVMPCRGNCALCGGPDAVRAGRRLFFDRNLLLWEEADQR
ncbi:MAG: hypothetical protein IKQ41_06375 [Clostridia bacterium]|nr:hypothetical protein [Clostridia bacterium]